MVVGSNPVDVTETSDVVSVSSKEFLNIEATIERRSTLKRVRDMIITYNNKNFRQVSFYRTHHVENKVLRSSVTGKNALVQYNLKLEDS